MSGDPRSSLESLELERTMLRTLIDWVPDFLYIKDLDGRFLVSNRAHFVVLGAEGQQEVLGKTDFDVFPREFAERYWADEREVLGTGLPMVERAEPIVDKQKRKGWVLTTKSPLRDEHGRVTGLIGMGRDITAQKLAEEALAIERDVVRTLMDGVPDYIYFKDPEGRFVRVNRAFAASVGRSDPADMIGKTDFDLWDKELAETFRESERRILETGEPLIGVEEHNVSRDGQERWVSTTKVPLRGGDGSVVGVLGISRDITEYKRSEERLKRSDKMASLGRLTAGIAHEMNTPLAAARAGLSELRSLVGEYREAVGDPAVNPDDHRAIAKEMLDALSIAEGALERCSAFVRGVKTQTRDLAQGERARFDAVRIIRDGLLLVQHDLKVRNCTVKFETDRAAVELLGNPGRLVQVLSNLVINAMDACSAAGRGQIQVALTTSDAGAELRVTDDGSGISPQNLAKIFDPMFTTKPFGEGTGLGLTIVYDIVVAEFGGSIDVSSKEGQGTTFTVRFPKD